MSLILETPPAAEPVTLDEVKAYLRVGDDEDAVLSQLIVVARQALDGRGGLLGRALVQQTWKLKLRRFAQAIEMPLPPLISVDEIAYIDANGDAQTVDLQTVTVEGIGDALPAIVRPVSGTSWPATRDRPEAGAITFKAGYGSAAADVPEPLRQAIKMHVGHLFEHRESVMFGSGFITSTPHGYDDLIANYRMWSF